MSTLDALTQGLFDYAGMFPPASLEFHQALEQAARHPKTLRRPGLVNVDMVVKPEHLRLLDDETMTAAGWRQGPCEIALVGFTDSQAEEQAKTVQAFNREHAGKEVVRRIVSFEPATPAASMGDLEKARDRLVVVRDSLKEEVQVYLEPRWDKQQWDDSAQAVFTLLSRLPERHRVGLKVRCAGPTRLDRQTLAHVLKQVSEHEIPLKATQGLHHPILEQHWGNTWGFLNLVTALRLVDTHRRDLPRSRLERLLAEADPKAFSFEDGLGWRDHQVDTHRLQASMQRVPLSIGSCSIQEPDDDLARLFP